MNTTKSIYRDMMTGLFFVTGIFDFMLGQFILSTLLVGAASLSSNLDLAAPAGN